jgi:p-methyltransferase
MIEKRYDFHWYSYFRCSNSDEEAIELMARSGCKGVFLGIESGSPAILKGMNKAASIGAYADGIRLLKQHGITTFGSFIVGFPGETDETVRETVDFIRHNKPDFYRAQLWYCEPGTPIYQEREKYGIAGQGFKWQHATMTAPSAMSHIEAMFLGIKESIWLPQWSFDFWFIPYAIGKGLSIEQFKEFVVTANEILKLEIGHTQIPERAKKASLKKIVNLASTWQVGV